MNVFSETAITELRRIGLQPLPILHVKELKNKLDKSLTVMFPMNGKLKDGEQLFIFRGDNDGVSDVTSIMSYTVGIHFLSIKLDHVTTM